MSRVKDLWLTTDKRPTAKYGHGKRWLAVWTGPHRGDRTKAFARKSDAERHLVMMEADQLRGTYVDPRRGAKRVRDYGDEKFLPSLVHLRPNSASTYASHLRNHIYPLLGDHRIGSLARQDIKAFVSAKAAELAPSTVETVVSVLKAMLASAVEDGYIPLNPAARVSLPQVTARVLTPLEPIQVLALAHAVPPRYRVGVALGAGAGLRFGEATGLTVPRAQLLRRRVHVLEQAQNGALAPVKTKASRRVVPIGDWVIEEIAGHLEQFGPGAGQVIMSNAAKKIINRNAFGMMWRPAVAAARTCGKGPADANAPPECGDACADPVHQLPAGTRFHDLRHFYASALIAANLNPKIIQARLGHATLAETMDTYGHLFADTEDLGRTAIDQVLRPVLTEPERNWSLHDYKAAGQSAGGGRAGL
jgi:integrase